MNAKIETTIIVIDDAQNRDYMTLDALLKAQIGRAHV